LYTKNILGCDATSDTTIAFHKSGIAEGLNVNANDLNIYPNPCSDRITLSYSLKTSSYVQIELWDLSGRMITRLAEYNEQTGKHQHTLSMTDKIKAGVYMLRLKCNDSMTIRELMIKGE
jgi:hypothetical protein